MPTSAEKLLGVVWGNRKGFVFLPTKDAFADGYPRRGWHETEGLPYTGRVPDLDALPPHSDHYFCPVVFSKPKRKKEYALPTNLLWSDLDTVHPSTCRLKPSVAWESSPGRYQALWFLSQDIDPNDAAELSKRIAYADGADKGGWDLTQVLRIPGSVNYKYPQKPPVALLWASRQIRYTQEQIWKRYPTIAQDPATSTPTPVSWPDVSQETLNSAIASLPMGVRAKLFSSTEGADRSMELQRLARSLLRFGLSSDLALSLLRTSSWNKFSGRSDELHQLTKQISDAQVAVDLRAQKVEKAKASASERTESSQSDDGFSPIQELQTYSWGEFLSIQTRLEWLVQDSWVDRTVGFISGRSKSFKTWIALDLATSVLSGEPFLGEHPVGRTGPVLLIQEEDPTAILQERLRLIAKAKGMLPKARVVGRTRALIEWKDYPLTIMNVQGFTLTNQSHLAQLRRMIGDIDPVMVVIDPLINVIGQIDENRATEVVQVLRELKQLREEFGTNVCVVHHWNKTATGEADRGGAHMYGSFALHAWLESAMHVEPEVLPETTRIDTVIMEREFKAAMGLRSQKLRFDIDTLVDFTYQVQSMTDVISDLTQQVLDAVLNAEEGEINTGGVMAVTGLTRQRVSEELGKLTRMHKIVGKRGGGRGRSSTYSPPGD